jgi:hypothetical protein
MKKLFLTSLLFSISAFSLIYSQDTLPDFTVKNVGNNRIIIGWVNNYEDIRQISIQRSFDSLNFYKSILTVADPNAIQNGYLDTKANHDHMFYRLYILLDKGVYLFSPAKRPFIDTTKKIADTKSKIPTVISNETKPDTVIIDGRMVIIQAKPISINIDNLQWGDSMAAPKPNHTKPQTITFMPSLHVFTGRDGYVSINLPEDMKAKKYSIKFFEEDGSFLFELKEIKERNFKMDKTNFYHAGWFGFELYESGKLIEKHKFYLTKDF